jgi:hypothetical protein
MKDQIKLVFALSCKSIMWQGEIWHVPLEIDGFQEVITSN